MPVVVAAIAGGVLAVPGHRVAVRFSPGVDSWPFLCGLVVASAGFAAGVAARWGEGLLGTAALVVASSVFVVLCLIDAREKRLPDMLTLPGAAVVAVLLAAEAVAVGESWPFVRALMTAGAWAAFLFVVFLVAPGFGFGDVKLGLLAGLAAGRAGAGAALLGLNVGVFAIAVFAVARRLAGNRDVEIPFGPAIAGGAMVGVLFPATLAGLAGTLS